MINMGIQGTFVKLTRIHDSGYNSHSPDQREAKLQENMDVICTEINTPVIPLGISAQQVIFQFDRASNKTSFFIWLST